MNPEQVVALDANCLTCFRDAMTRNPSEPRDKLAEQKVALLRTLFYSPDTKCFSISLTVKKEIENIPDPDERADHESWYVLFCDVLIKDENAVKTLAD